MDNTNKIKILFNNINPLLIAEPCAVENYEMMEMIIISLMTRGISVIRSGAYKPRTSPNDFQGLGEIGLEILDHLRKKYKVKIVSEIVDVRHLELMCNKVDILQVGARNMYNYELLKELGKTRMPIVLKRSFCATIDEFVNAASYITQYGNENVILCERGIRSFDTSTRNVLDLSCVALIKQRLELPIIVDISHSLGRKDIALPMAKASIAAGADGLMIEVHNEPMKAYSDQKQQMNLLEFEEFTTQLFQ